MLRNTSHSSDAVSCVEFLYALIHALEKGMATRSSILTRSRIPWTEEPGGLQSMALQRVGHNSAQSMHAEAA